MAKKKQVFIHPPEMHTAVFQIEGITPYLADGMPAGAMAEMKQPGQSSSKKVKTPKKEDQTPKEIAASRVTWIEPSANGRKKAVPGVKGSMFHASMINACRRIDNMSMTEAKGLFFVEGMVLPLAYEEMLLQTDIGKRPPGPRGTPCDIHRYAFHGWSVELPITYEITQITLEMLTHILNYAGFTVGIGGYRPYYGRFRVAKVAVIESDYGTN